MSDDLVKRLREGCVCHEKRWFGDTHDDLGGTINEAATDALLDEAADRIEALESLFPAILEYLEQEADVVDGDNGVPYPNAAMSLLIWTRHALEGK